MNQIESILYTEAEIKKRVVELGKEITKDYQGQDLVLIGILKGAIVFFSDLMREIETPVTVDFMAVSSYGESHESSGAVRILKDLDVSIENRHVLIVEDIVDTGLTLAYLKRILQSRNPLSIKVASFLDKPERRQVDTKADYVGYAIPDKFVIGYGLDFAEQYRSLPYIGVLAPSAYQDL